MARTPFPGMDPFTERRWLDLHLQLIVTSARRLQHQLSDDLIVTICQRVISAGMASSAWHTGTNLRLVEVGSRGQPPIVPTITGVALAEPIRFAVPSEPIRQRFLQIIDVSTGGRVITVIEFVSPTNKLPGDGRKQYRQKQDECYGARVNLVEIDLTRTGDRELLCHRWATARRHESTYQVSCWRAAWPSEAELYPVPLRSRLPAFRTPLRPDDPDAVLDLQAVFEECYADARYDRTIDYARNPEPPLEGDDAAWADELLRAAGRR